MKLEVGKTYRYRQSAMKICTIRIDSEYRDSWGKSNRRRWRATNLDTGRTLTIKSTRKILREVVCSP